jgi:hypothetical protein
LFTSPLLDTGTKIARCRSGQAVEERIIQQAGRNLLQ